MSAMHPRILPLASDYCKGFVDPHAGFFDPPSGLRCRRRAKNASLGGAKSAAVMAPADIAPGPGRLVRLRTNNGNNAI